MTLLSPGVRQEDLQLLARAVSKLNEKQEQALCEDSLYEFLAAGWQHIDPAIFTGGWHLEAIAEHLEAVTRGDIKRLLINCPPRMSKSSVVSVAWPAWTWAIQRNGYLSGPQVQFLYASYAESLSVRDSVKTRRLIESPWYQKKWGNRFRLTGDQNTKIRFENDHGGYRLSTSVGGTLTGEGGSVLTIDDGHNANEVESDLVRKGVLNWYDEVFTTRMNDPRNGAIVVIGQRVHQEDISGHILDQGDFVHLCLPMEYDDRRHCVTVLGIDQATKQELTWEDPRSIEGQMLCEERYGPEELAQFKRRPFVWAGQFQQTPVPKGGSIIKEDSWNYWTKESAYDLKLEWRSGKYPEIEYIVASADTAFTEKKENDPSALTIWGVFRDGSGGFGSPGNPKMMLLHAWEGRLEFHQLVQKIIDTCSKDEREVSGPRFNVDRLLIEAKASGMSVGQELRRLVGFTGKFGIELINPDKYGDKVNRVHAVQHLWEDGMIYVPYTEPYGYEWVNKVIDQCAAFPRASHDDLVDSASMALRYLRDHGFAMRREEHAVEVSDSLMYKSRMQPLYDC